MRKLTALIPLILLGCGGAEQADTDADMPRGVSDDSIVIGSHNDLSGVLAIWGVPSSNGQLEPVSR